MDNYGHVDIHRHLQILCSVLKIKVRLLQTLFCLSVSKSTLKTFPNCNGMNINDVSNSSITPRLQRRISCCFPLTLSTTVALCDQFVPSWSQPVNGLIGGFLWPWSQVGQWKWPMCTSLLLGRETEFRVRLIPVWPLGGIRPEGEDKSAHQAVNDTFEPSTSNADNMLYRSPPSRF